VRDPCGRTRGVQLLLEALLWGAGISICSQTEFIETIFIGRVSGCGGNERRGIGWRRKCVAETQKIGI